MRFLRLVLNSMPLGAAVSLIGSGRSAFLGASLCSMLTGLMIFSLATVCYLAFLDHLAGLALNNLRLANNLFLAHGILHDAHPAKVV